MPLLWLRHISKKSNNKYSPLYSTQKLKVPAPILLPCAQCHGGMGWLLKLLWNVMDCIIPIIPIIPTSLPPSHHPPPIGTDRSCPRWPSAESIPRTVLRARWCGCRRQKNAGAGNEQLEHQKVCKTLQTLYIYRYIGCCWEVVVSFWRCSVIFEVNLHCFSFWM